MKPLTYLLLALFTATLTFPAHAESWLDAKRRDAIQQRKVFEETRRYEQERMEDEKQQQREEKRRMREKKEREKRLQQEEDSDKEWREEQAKKAQQRKLEQEQLLSEQKRRHAEEQAQLDLKRQRAGAAEATARELQKYRLNALQSFDAIKGNMWLTTKAGLIAFREKKECQEYVEYLRTKAAYAQSYARELLDDSAVEVGKNGHLKVQESNYKTLLPTESELRNKCWNAEDITAFETQESMNLYLKEQAVQRGIVRIRTLRGDEFWVAYRDLAEHAVPETASGK